MPIQQIAYARGRNPYDECRLRVGSTSFSLEESTHDPDELLPRSNSDDAAILDWDDK